MTWEATSFNPRFSPRFDIGLSSEGNIAKLCVTIQIEEVWASMPKTRSGSGPMSAGCLGMVSIRSLGTGELSCPLNFAENLAVVRIPRLSRRQHLDLQGL